METHRINAQSGKGFHIPKGEEFEVIDPNGSQVADLVAFNENDIFERFSPKYTYRINSKLRVTKGDKLYSTEGEPILEIIEDDCGLHDLLYPPCCEWVLDRYYDQQNQYGCRENLREALEPAGVSEDQLMETFNIFMKSTVEDQTNITLEGNPVSNPGDTIRFKAHQETIVGVSSCAGESIVNAGEPDPIDIRVPSGTEFTD